MSGPSQAREVHPENHPFFAVHRKKRVKIKQRIERAAPEPAVGRFNRRPLADAERAAIRRRPQVDIRGLVAGALGTTDLVPHVVFADRLIHR